jgi:two-component system, OmpR family, phosphate regulon response regulator PhoB
MVNHILIVEDEQDLSDIIAYNLRLEGYKTTMAGTGTEALDYVKKGKFNLILLDLMLPDMSGTEVCRRIRANDNNNNVPIIMVTAKGEEIDRVVGFEVGADDYVVKPFSARELMLRVRAVLRRKEPTQHDNEIQFSVFNINVPAHRVMINDEEVILTALEFKLLLTLLQRKGHVQTREMLLEDVWNMDPNVNTRTVDKHVQRLRQKIGVGASFIETIRGVGYRFKVVP